MHGWSAEAIAAGAEVRWDPRSGEEGGDSGTVLHTGKACIRKNIRLSPDIAEGFLKYFSILRRRNTENWEKQTLTSQAVKSGGLS